MGVVSTELWREGGREGGREREVILIITNTRLL